MKIPLGIVIIFLLFGSTCFSQENATGQSGFFQLASYSNVHVLLLINYAHGLSSGEYFYPEYRINRTKSEFLIEALDKKVKRRFYIPFGDPELSKIRSDDPEKYWYAVMGHYFSNVVTYTINDTPYTVYEHADYNCYDPHCGNKHSHIPFQIGVTYFSPEYGILVQVDNQDMQYQLMSRMKEKTVPHALVIEILKRRKTDEKIIREYQVKTRQMAQD